MQKKCWYAPYLNDEAPNVASLCTNINFSYSWAKISSNEESPVSLWSKFALNAFFVTTKLKELSSQVVLFVSKYGYQHSYNKYHTTRSWKHNAVNANGSSNYQESLKVNKISLRGLPVWYPGGALTRFDWEALANFLCLKFAIFFLSNQAFVNLLLWPKIQRSNFCGSKMFI